MASEAKQLNKLKQRLAEQTRPRVESAMSVIPCWKFFKVVLNITLTPAQSLIVKVCVDGVAPESLSAEELELYPTIFGMPADRKIPDICRIVVMLLLGRASGKSLMVSGIAIYLALTLSCKGVGPGQIPMFFIVAPEKSTAQEASMGTVRSLVIENPKLAGFVTDSGDDFIEMTRPDGARVRIKAVAADKGGRNTRGRDILGFVLEEAQFFNSDPSGRYIVNDRDVYRAMMPRLIRGGRGFFVSTPWPTENYMSEEMLKNHGHPVTCLTAIAPTHVMRPDNPQLQEYIEKERVKDPENAKREFDCDTEAVSIGSFFDQSALRASVPEDTDFLEFLDPTKYPVACGVDFAFKRDSSTICIVQFDGKRYRTVYMEELIPTEGHPLKPSEVVEHFAKIAKAHSCRFVISDGFYRESIKEHLDAFNIGLLPAPEGATGKLKTYLRTKSMLDDNKLYIPNNAKFITQASMVSAKPTSGGTITIKVPRHTGMGHGDMISSWVLAVHHLSYSKTVEKLIKPRPGDEGYWEYLDKKIKSKEQASEDRYVRELELEVSGKKKNWRFS